MTDQKDNSILIVDDEKPNLLYLNSLLSAEYSIFIAKDGREAVAKANELQPDLILMDILMPGMDGYEALAALKSSEATKAIPVVFITGLDDVDDERKGLALGADDYISKPFHDAIVQLRVRNQMKIVNQMRTIERMSMTDKLTDLANRRSFDKQLSTEWKRSARDRSPISILMVDIDKFKEYNDTYGHQQGDRAIKAVAEVIANTFKRPADFPARWGGEEFAVLLPMTDLDGALAVSEKLRSNVEGIAVPCDDGPPTKITVSIGINTEIPTQTEDTESFVKKADTALYQAKRGGRNKVCKDPCEG